MGTRTAAAFALVCHPAAISTVVRAVTVAVEREAATTLRLSYSISGDPDRIRVPPSGATGFADELWRTTCCEAFLRPPGDAGYFELNLSPSRAWAAYRFAAYRAGVQRVAFDTPPRITVRRSAAGIALDAILSLSGGMAGPWSAQTAVGLSAIVEDDAVKSCWALGHNGAQPDFHDSRSFLAQLGSPLDVAASI